MRPTPSSGSTSNTAQTQLTLITEVCIYKLTAINSWNNVFIEQYLLAIYYRQSINRGSLFVSVCEEWHVFCEMDSGTGLIGL